MSVIAVDSVARRLRFGPLDVPCSIGKGGTCAAVDKREGDGCTPLGQWQVRGVLLRRERITSARLPGVPWRWTQADDGWSDDIDDPDYNRPVSLPHRFSAENLQRDDEAYDVIVVIGHNDMPPVPGAGSAIFFHCWIEGRPTEGCVAIAKADMLTLLPMLMPDTIMDIR